MFRDDAQASTAIRLLLTQAGLDPLWNDAGPVRREEGVDLPPEKQTLLLAAWNLWTPVAPSVPLGEVVRNLDPASCSALCTLIVAYKRGADAVDAWIADAAPPRAAPLPEPDAWSPGTPISSDWPTLDLLTLRYVVLVLDRMENNKSRAGEMLGVDRRTVSRLLAAAARAGLLPKRPRGKR